MVIEASCSEMLDSIKQLSPLIRDHIADGETHRSVAQPVIDASIEAGIFNLTRPKAFGGLEFDPVSVIRTVEEIARQDSSLAWNVLISVGVGHLMSGLPDEGAAEVFGIPNALFATSFNPPGKAMAVDEGFRLTGRWTFGSGSGHAQWIMLLAVIFDDDVPRVDASGAPELTFVVVPTDEIKILNNWDTMGMRATGSHDVTVDNVLVPHSRSFVPSALLTNPGSAFGAPTYRLTISLTVALLAATALGTARAAVEDFVDLAVTKTPAYMGSGLSQRQVVQRQVAQADAHIRAAKAFLYEAFDEAHRAVIAGEPLDLERKRILQQANTHGMASAVQAVDLVCSAAGTSSIHNALPFQRYFRDVNTMKHHAFTSAQRFESMGAVMLGAQTDWRFFGL